MAIHNQIILYGQVTDPPKITKTDEGEYVRGSFNVMVTPGQRETGIKKRKKDLGKVEYIKIPVMSGDPNLIPDIDKMEQGDIVLIKGNLTTRNVVKKKSCPKCGTVHKKDDGTITFVSPIDVNIEHKGLSEAEGIKILKGHKETSNIATIIGTICHAPEMVNHKHMPIAQFQLAINRKYFIPDDNVETRTDWPWVKVHGEEKISDVLLRCKQGTVVFVDGLIQTRSLPDLKFNCDNPSCDGEIIWKYWTIDIIPYQLEYLQNWRSDGEIENDSQAKKDEIFDKLGLTAIDEN